jgi:hypothetical protein
VGYESKLEADCVALAAARPNVKIIVAQPVTVHISTTKGVTVVIPRIT